MTRLRRSRRTAVEDELIELYRIGRGPPKRPTAVVNIPACALVRGGRAMCSPDCVACESSRTGRDRRPSPTISPETVRRLHIAGGAPFRLLLTLYRWARPYSAVPGGEAVRRRRLFNATHRAAMAGLAKESLGSSSPSNVLKVNRSVELLETAGIVHVIREPRQANIYVPHAIGRPVRLPQSLWSTPGYGRAPFPVGSAAPPELLNGAELVILTFLLAHQNLEFDPADSARSATVIKEIARRGLLLSTEYELSQLPISARRRNDAALTRLEDRKLIKRFRVRGTDFVVAVDPPRGKPVGIRSRTPRARSR